MSPMDGPPLWPVYVWGAIGMFLPAFGFGYFCGRWNRQGGRILIHSIFPNWSQHEPPAA